MSLFSWSSSACFEECFLPCANILVLQTTCFLVRFQLFLKSILCVVADVLDLAWSPQDVWLASCSVDNTIVVWNALKFPGQPLTSLCSYVQDRDCKRHYGNILCDPWSVMALSVLSERSDGSTL